MLGDFASLVRRTSRPPAGEASPAEQGDGELAPGATAAAAAASVSEGILRRQRPCWPPQALCWPGPAGARGHLSSPPHLPGRRRGCTPEAGGRGRWLGGGSRCNRPGPSAAPAGNALLLRGAGLLVPGRGARTPRWRRSYARGDMQGGRERGRRPAGAGRVPTSPPPRPPARGPASRREVHEPELHTPGRRPPAGGGDPDVKRRPGRRGQRDRRRRPSFPPRPSAPSGVSVLGPSPWPPAPRQDSGGVLTQGPPPAPAPRAAGPGDPGAAASITEKLYKSEIRSLPNGTVGRLAGRAEDPA